MKLLIYSHFFAPSVGGTETIVQSLARGLARSRDDSGQSEFTVTLVTKTVAGEFDDGLFPFQVIRCPGLRHLWRLIRESDVVHAAGAALSPMILGMLARKPVVVEHHGFQAICPNGQLLIEPAGVPCPGHFMAGHHAVCLRCNAVQGRVASLKLWLLTFVRRLLCRKVAHNINPTAWLGDLIQLPRAVTIPHGLESAASLSAVQAKPCPPPLIVFLGRLVTTKGVRVLLEAARILCENKKEFELLLVGDGPERATLEGLAQQRLLTGHVRFAGRLFGEDLDTVLARAALIVVPSLGGEVFGLAVAENMLRGLPVITSNLGAFVEVVGDGALTFPVGDAAALAREISRVLDDPAFAAQLSKGARQRALAFCDFQRMVEAHVRVYRQTQS